MGERAEEMIRVALALVRAAGPSIAAETLVELDELIDRANRRVVNRTCSISGASPSCASGACG